MIADLSTFGLVISQEPLPVPCSEHRVLIKSDKTLAVAWGIARKERTDHPDIPVEISPTRQGEDGLWDRFRVDRMEV